MIHFDQVGKTYSLNPETRIAAVSEVDLRVACGEFIIITGRSGSGKTTLLNLAAGLTRPTSGRVCLDEVDLWSLPDDRRSELRNRRMGFVFQFPSLLPTLTVLENLILPAAFGPSQERGKVRQQAVELLERMGVAEKRFVYPRQLSAGQQQRVVIARALVNRPEILLADEPTSNLDEQTETEIMDLLRQIHADTGVTILMVTHTSQLVGYGSRAIQMASGRILNGRVT